MSEDAHELPSVAYEAKAVLDPFVDERTLKERVTERISQAKGEIENLKKSITDLEDILVALDEDPTIEPVLKTCLNMWV